MSGRRSTAARTGQTTLLSWGIVLQHRARFPFAVPDGSGRNYTVQLTHPDGRPVWLAVLAAHELALIPR